MRATITATLLLLAACGSRDESTAGNESVARAAEAGEAPSAPAKAAPAAKPAERWDLQSSGEGVALALPAAPSGTAIRLFCPAGENRLLVNVPAFRPIGSEERLSFGSGGAVAALVADPARRSAAGAAAAEHARRRFSFEHVLDEHERLYESLRAGTPGPRA